MKKLYIQFYEWLNEQWIPYFVRGNRLTRKQVFCYKVTGLMAKRYRKYIGIE